MNTEQIREAAVDAVLTQNRLISEVAQSYAVSKRQVYNWVRSAKRADRLEQKPPALKKRTGELLRCRQQLARSLARLDAELASLRG